MAVPPEFAPLTFTRSPVPDIVPPVSMSRVVSPVGEPFQSALGRKRTLASALSTSPLAAETAGMVVQVLPLSSEYYHTPLVVDSSVIPTTTTP